VRLTEFARVVARISSATEGTKFFARPVNDLTIHVFIKRGGFVEIDGTKVGSREGAIIHFTSLVIQYLKENQIELQYQ
jgi:hypothetical protein